MDEYQVWVRYAELGPDECRGRYETLEEALKTAHAPLLNNPSIVSVDVWRVTTKVEIVLTRV